MIILKSRKEQRLSHWRDIKTRVTTHEGEVLSGSKGREYQQKYSRQHLGVDLSKPIDLNKSEYQEALNMDRGERLEDKAKDKEQVK